MEVFLGGDCSHAEISVSFNFLLFSNLSGLLVQSKKLPDTDNNPASDTDERRLPEPNGVRSNCKRCEKRLRLRLLKLTGNESRRSVFGVLAILFKYCNHSNKHISIDSAFGLRKCFQRTAVFY